MTKVSKTDILKMLSLNLEIFQPSMKNHFMCPTCLTPISLQDKDRISEAHIIPKAANGTLKTYLCKKCNSHFGTNQDKWFGELIKLANKETRSILNTDIKDGHFWIDGVRINGHWNIGHNKQFSFYRHVHRNSPEVNKGMDEKFRSNPPKIDLKISFPILKNQQMINIGFLTAGYLMWFATLGYSWVFQSHLEPIRNQIMNPDKDILGRRFIAYCKDTRWQQPWIGFLSLSNEILLAMGFENHLVFFPPVDRPQLFSTFGNDFSELTVSNIRRLNFKDKPAYGPAILLMLDDRVLIAPDSLKPDEPSLVVLQFISTSSDVNVLTPIPKEEFNKQAKMPGVVVKNIKSNVKNGS